MKTVLAAIALLATFLFAPPAEAGPLRVTGLSLEREYSAEEFASLPRAHVSVVQHGETHVYEGVALSTLLASVDAPLGSALRGPALAIAVVIVCTDGYRVAIALADVDPAMRDGLVLIADRMDGAPLSAADGPFRLVVEGDKRLARSARMVSSIRLYSLGAWVEPSTDAP